MEEQRRDESIHSQAARLRRLFAHLKDSALVDKWQRLSDMFGGHRGSSLPPWGGMCGLVVHTGVVL